MLNCAAFFTSSRRSLAVGPFECFPDFIRRLMASSIFPRILSWRTFAIYVIWAQAGFTLLGEIVAMFCLHQEEYSPPCSSDNDCSVPSKPFSIPWWQQSIYLKNWYRHSSEYFMLCEPSALQYNIYAALKMERLRSTFYLFCRSEIHLKSTGSYWDVWCFSENPNEFRRETFKILIWDWFYSKQLIVGIINYRMQTPCIHNKGKGIWFESKQPFVGKSVVWWHLKQIGLNLVLDPWLI